MTDSPRKKDGESRRQREKRRARKLERRLLEVLESRLRDAQARDAELLAMLRASAAGRLTAAELEERLATLRAELERALDERLARRLAREDARRAAPEPPSVAPPSPPSPDALMAVLEERLHSAREQDLRHREALFGHALRWVGLPLAFALVVLGALGLKALSDLRTVANAVGGRAARDEAPALVDEPATRDAPVEQAPPDATPRPLDTPHAALARRTPAHPELARLLDPRALERCNALDEFAPLVALIEPLTDAPAGEEEPAATARREHVTMLLARCLHEPFRLVALERDGEEPRLAVALRGAEDGALELGPVLARESFQHAVDTLLREAATQPTLAALHARVDRFGAPHDAGDPMRGERAFVVRARLGDGARVVPHDGASVDAGDVELTILPGASGAPLAVRRAGSTEAWRPLRFLERPERIEFRLVPFDAPR